MHSLLAPRRSLGGVALSLIAALHCPAIAAAASGGDPAQTAELLARIGRQVEAFTRQFSDVKCTERVTQSKLNHDGKVRHTQESSFDYLLMARDTGKEVILDESRLKEREAGHTREFSMLVTNGFATLLLIFHPNYQSNFEFSWLEDEVVDGHPWHRLRFRHIPGTRSLTILRLEGRSYPLELEGIVWIDPASAAIGKISAGLTSSMKEPGLRLLQSEVRYDAVPFTGGVMSLWLPVSATIEMQTLHDRWRNTHLFTEYKRFSVSTKTASAVRP